jgi:hypothetical protein
VHLDAARRHGGAHPQCQTVRPSCRISLKRRVAARSHFSLPVSQQLSDRAMFRHRPRLTHGPCHLPFAFTRRLQAGPASAPQVCVRPESLAAPLNGRRPPRQPGRHRPHHCLCFCQTLTNQPQPFLCAQAFTPPTARPSAARPGSRASPAAQTSGARAPRARRRPCPARSAAPATRAPAPWVTSTAPRWTTASPCRATAGSPATGRTPAPLASSERGEGSGATVLGLFCLPVGAQGPCVPCVVHARVTDNVRAFVFLRLKLNLSHTKTLPMPAPCHTSNAARPPCSPSDLHAPRRPLLPSNPGGNSRKCSPCPGGLSTKTTATANAQDCLAPAGYYQLQGKAVAVSSGS